MQAATPSSARRRWRVISNILLALSTAMLVLLYVLSPIAGVSVTITIALLVWLWLWVIRWHATIVSASREKESAR